MAGSGLALGALVILLLAFLGWGDSGRVLDVGQTVGVEFDSRQASVFSA